MPIAFKEVDGGLGTAWKASGILTAEDLIELYEYMRSISERGQWSYRFNISDFSAVTGTDIPTPGLRRAVGYAKANYAANPDGIVAIIVPQDVLFGLARMWSAFMGEPTWETMVFRERDEACGWIRRRVKERWGIENLTFA